MPDNFFINVDLAKLWRADDESKFIRTLAWGDAVEVEAQSPMRIQVKTAKFVTQPDGSILPTPVRGVIKLKAGGPKPADVIRPLAEQNVLKVNFVDVQQGDGSVIETPRGRVILVDGGDNQLFARYLAGRFRGTDAANPLPVECIVVSHGDADHFLGLPEIWESETNTNPRKRLFMQPKRVYHNGLVKRPTKDANGKTIPETATFGKTVTVNGRKVITELETDLRTVDDAKMNQPFRKWKQVLNDYSKRGDIELRRLAQGDDDAFDFVRDEGIQVEVLAPILTPVDGGAGLAFLGNPPAGPHIGADPDAPTGITFSGYSASHTINGHSIIFRLTYGKCRFLFAGDLNEQAELELVKAPKNRLRAEVFKVPHHGSADFSGAFLHDVSPLVSVISSGDESTRKEYIHPRASLMGALGRNARSEDSLVLVTELVAFFRTVGFVYPERHAYKDGAYVVKNGKVVDRKNVPHSFFAFDRTAYGLVKTRTDGKRLLVYTDSGNVQLKEAYAFTLDGTGGPKPAAVIQV